MTTLRDNSTASDPRLGRLPQFDERSRSFNVRSLFAAAQVPRSYTWACTTNLDQGADGACVGFSWAHELAARPYARPASNTLGHAIYHSAQKLDEWEGGSYPGASPIYEGSSVLAGAKAAQSMGHISTYRWAFTVDDALTVISRHGPAVIGIWWWTGMFDTDSKGFIHPTGQREGGHAILVRGVNVKARTVLLHNSWGASWGGTKWGPGTALLSWEDFGFLLQDGGECCVPVLRGA